MISDSRLMVQSLPLQLVVTGVPIKIMNPFSPRDYIRDPQVYRVVCLALALFSWCGLDLAFQAERPMSVIYPLG